MSTTAPTRDEIATRALLEPEEKTICGMVLRPVSLGSLSLLRVTRNEFLVPAGPEQLNPLTGVMDPTLENVIFATMAFAYIHAGPLNEA